MSQSYTVIAGAGIPTADAEAGNPRYVSAPMWFGRYWEAAETTRLNSAHWGAAADTGINEWLDVQLPTLRARAQYESRQNATLKGVLNTSAEDVVGPSGPTLQVQSDNSAYNDAAEQAWRDWFRAPTTKPNVSGAQMLKLWIRRLGTCGEFVARKVTDREAGGSVSMRLLLYHPRHLANPATNSANRRMMGVEINALGRPVRYWLPEEVPFGISTLTTVYAPFPPDLIVHEFMLEDEEQVRGVPWLSACLDSAADLRDFDDQTMDGARQSADQSVILYTDSPNAEPYLMPESTTVERRTIKMAPPQWKPFNYTPAQPATQYVPYREEKQRDFGRPIGMPLMIVRLDSTKASYSSARFDGQNWRRTVSSLQIWLSGDQQNTGVLSRLCDDVLAEARFTVSALRNRPDRVSYEWTWPALPHVDPEKEARASTERQNNGTETVSDGLAATGSNLESYLAKRRREMDAFEAADVPYPIGQKAASPVEDETDPDEEKEPADAEHATA